MPTPAPELSPIALTAADGSGLRLTSLDVLGAVADPHAMTELHLEFENPRAETIEGRFSIVLPPEARVIRFAMKIGDEWREAEVVERARSRVVYESFLHQRRDPALLEQDAANRFGARVFPIAGHERKQLILSYVQELPDPAEPYHVPLVGLPWLDRASFRVGVREGHETRVLEEVRGPHRPTADLEVARSGAAELAVRSGRAFVARVIPFATDPGPAPLSSLTILFDTSASMQAELERSIADLRALAGALARGGDPATPVEVIAFDQEVAPVFTGTLATLATAGLDTIVRRRALGASNLERALESLHRRTNVGARVLLWTDGVPTAGATAPDALAGRVEGLAGRGVRRLDAIVVGSVSDRAVLSGLAGADLPEPGIVAEASLGADHLAKRLRSQARGDVEIHVPGAAWSWPRTLEGVQAGDAVLIHGELAPGKRGSGDLAIELRGPEARRIVLRATRRDDPLVEHGVAGAHVDALIAALATSAEPDRDRRRAEVAVLSTRHRVLNEYTSMIVLETEHDYARFGLDRLALAEVLEIVGDGVRRIDRRNGVDPSVRRPRTIVVETKPLRADSVTSTKVDMSKVQDLPVGSTSRDFTDVVTLAPTVTKDAAGFRFGGSTGAEGRPPEPPPVAPHRGNFASAMKSLSEGRVAEAVETGETWHEALPGDPLALFALGEAWHRQGNDRLAARAYGSIVDLFPSRAEMRRAAGNRLERLGAAGLELAIDTYEKARADRPDHPSSHRMLALALVRAGRFERAFAVLEEALARPYPEGRFAGYDRVLRDDLGLVAAAWLHDRPADRRRVLVRLAAAGATLAAHPSVRFVLTWESDANDMDLQIVDANGHQADFGHPKLPSGGHLVADVVNGFGPEAFVVDEPDRFPYRLRVHYFNPGVMGHGIGTIHVLHHDGAGKLTFDHRPFVVTQRSGTADLGRVER